MEIRLTAEQETRLAELAARQGRDANDLAREALTRYLEDDSRFVEAVVKGLASLDRGEFVTHAEVGRRIERLLES
jgi:predicted transcriptional regulator